VFFDRVTRAGVVGAIHIERSGTFIDGVVA
jgi:hypothetical protein